MAVTEHWLKTPHWSSDIPLDTPHPRLGALAEHGYLVLRDVDPPIPESEWMGLEYFDWKSGGDTNFAPIATADGELECRGFWKDGDERTDKDGLLTSNAAECPVIVAEVTSVGANYGRVRVSSSSSRRATRRRCVRSTATTTTASTRMATAGWCVRGSSSPTTPTAS